MLLNLSANKKASIKPQCYIPTFFIAIHTRILSFLLLITKAKNVRTSVILPFGRLINPNIAMSVKAMSLLTVTDTWTYAANFTPTQLMNI